MNQTSSRIRCLRLPTGVAVIAMAFAVALAAAAPTAAAPTPAPQTKPTVVLVRGAFAESSSWNPVITQLAGEGYPVIAIANPLRGVKTDVVTGRNLGEDLAK